MELYKKKYKYFNTDTDKEDEFEVYDAIEHLKAGIVYKAVKKNTKDAYSKIGFKFTAGRKIETKLARSTNQILRSYYYDWNNAIFIKVGDVWKESNSGWIGQAERVKNSLKGRSQAQVDKFVCYYISLFFRTRSKELVMMNSDNYLTLTDAEKKFVVMAFYSSSRFSIHWPGYPYNIYVPAESDFHLKQSPNFLSSFSYQGVIETGKGVGVGLDSFVDMPFNKLQG